MKNPVKKHVEALVEHYQIRADTAEQLHRDNMDTENDSIHLNTLNLSKAIVHDLKMLLTQINK